VLRLITQILTVRLPSTRLASRADYGQVSVPVRMGYPHLSVTVQITHFITRHLRSFLGVRMLKQEFGSREI
jgi:hypothetical protein